jgi:Ca2+-binding RTX toxin-like protein
VIQGTDGNDTILGTAGDDLIIGSRGQDTVDGGAGRDTLLFENAFAQAAAIGRQGAEVAAYEFAWRDSVGEHSTIFSNIELIEALDFRVDLAADSAGAQVWGLYRGLLGRDADLPGLAFWRDYVEGSGALGVAEALLASGEGQAILAGTSQEAIIGQLYQQVLNREAGADEIAFWNGVAAQQGLAAVATYIVTSAEAATDPAGQAAMGIPSADLDAAWVGHVYAGLLRRGVEVEGLKFFTTQMDGGLDWKGVSDFIAGSAEFAARTGSLSNADFVEGLYRDVLGRESDAGGKAFQVSQLDAGASRADVAFGFLHSQEGLQSYQGYLYSGVDVLI